MRYTLNPSTKSARRFNNQKILAEVTVSASEQAASPAVKALLKSSVAGKANVVVLPNVVSGIYSDSKAEQLGTKSFEGVAAQGTRTVTTVPTPT